MDMLYIEDDATLRRLSEWKDRQLQQQHAVTPTKNPNGSNRHCPTTFVRDSTSSSSSSSSSSCVTVSTELLSETSSSLDDTSFDESCSLTSSSSTCTLVLVSSNDEENRTNNNQQQQQQQQQPRRRRRRRSKNNTNNNNKLVGRRVNVPNNKNSNCNSRLFSSLPTPTTTTTSGQITEQEKNNYIAMDCEMVGIGPRGTTSRLARVALVSHDGSVLYDTHVQVTEFITDHRTHVSGILPSDLLSSNGAVSFDEARSKVRSLIRNKILVGHGLKNDFAVLCIYDHPWYDVRDTARYEPFMRRLKHQHHRPDDDDRCVVVVDYDNINNNNDTMTQPPLLVPKKLKTLAHDKLGMYIQLVGMSHSPVEDAIAAMELYKRHRVKWERVVQYKMDRTREMMMMITTPRRN